MQAPFPVQATDKPESIVKRHGFVGLKPRPLAVWFAVGLLCGPGADTAPAQPAPILWKRLVAEAVGAEHASSSPVGAHPPFHLQPPTWATDAGAVAGKAPGIARFGWNSPGQRPTRRPPKLHWDVRRPPDVKRPTRVFSDLEWVVFQVGIWRTVHSAAYCQPLRVGSQ
jgi:hypothetical protein